MHSGPAACGFAPVQPSSKAEAPHRPPDDPPMHTDALLRMALVFAAMSWLQSTPAAAGEPRSAGGPAARISAAEKQPDGLLVHTVRSPFQAGETRIKVLLPDRLERGKRYAVLYVLPVEAGEGSRYGDGLAEITRHDLHNKHRLICVAPTFSHLPWYADHPTDPRIRQESYLLGVVLPFVERTYAAQTDRKGRLLLGFSKSGWGALSLLLRHPDTFGRAAAWDAPLVEDRPARFGMGPIFGTQESFEQYRITNLFKERAAELRAKPPRLVLTGYGNFRDQQQAAHRQMTALEIPHVWRDGPRRKHDWHSGWVAEAVGLLTSAWPAP